MKKLQSFTLSAVLTLVLCPGFAVASPVTSYTFKTFKDSPVRQIQAYHGENIEINHEFATGTVFASARFHWQTNGMSQAWFEEEATVSNNIISYTWTPANDTGASAFRYFVAGVTDTDGISYRGNGTIRLLPSPGFVPAAVSFPESVYAEITNTIENVRAEINGKPNQSDVDAVNAKITALEKSQASSAWISPSDWTLQALYTGKTTVSPSVITEEAGVRLIKISSTVYTPEKQVEVFTVSLDELTTSPPPMASITVENNAAPITNNRFIDLSDVNGSITIQGWYNYVIRKIRISLAENAAKTNINEKVYISDLNTERNISNNAFLSKLTTRDDSWLWPIGITPGALVSDKIRTTDQYLSCPLPASALSFTSINKQGKYGFAIAPRFVMTAAHWGTFSIGETVQFMRPNGTIVSRKIITGLTAETWFKNAGMSLGRGFLPPVDFQIMQVDEDIPGDCLPYFATREKLQSIYGTLSGLGCYTATQDGMLSYGIITTDFDNSETFDGYNRLSFSFGFDFKDLLLIRYDLFQAYNQNKDSICRIYGGDSGKPIFIMHENKPVILSCFTTINCGSDLSYYLPYIKQMTRSLSPNGYEIKEIQ